jgi:hypothetical protein
MTDKYLRVRTLTKGLWKRRLLGKSKASAGNADLDDQRRSSRDRASPSLPSRKTISEVLR